MKAFLKYKAFVLCLLLCSFVTTYSVTTPQVCDAAVAQQALVVGYDAEAQIGLVPNNSDPGIAAANTARLNLALAAMRLGGKYYFIDRAAGPVLLPIVFSGKSFYFKGPILTSDRAGGALIGVGHSYESGEAAFAINGWPGGMVTKLIRIDGENGGPVIRLRGASFRLEGVELWGRRLLLGIPGTGLGTKTATLIEVEGRNQPATGRHIIRDVSLHEGAVGIRALAGYYEGNTFVPVENHADETSVEGTLECSALDTVFRSENLQAVFWNFERVIVNSFGYGVAGVSEDCVVLDMVRGGNVTIDNLQMNTSRATILKVTDPMAPNCNRYKVNFEWDHAEDNANSYLTLFKFAGANVADASGYKWAVRMTGHMSSPGIAYDSNRLIEIGAGAVGFPKNDLLFDITNMPVTNFTQVGGGPWYHPN
jgi:hypothetical protein